MAKGVHRRGAALALVVLLAAPAVGCGAAQPDGAAKGTATGSPADAAPAPRTTSPQDLCVRVVGHWAREALRRSAEGYGAYGDYQSMGLSDRQYALLTEVVDAARAERRSRGERAAEALIGRRTEAGCAGFARDGVPAEGPWG